MILPRINQKNSGPPENKELRYRFVNSGSPKWVTREDGNLGRASKPKSCLGKFGITDYTRLPCILLQIYTIVRHLNPLLIAYQRMKKTPVRSSKGRPLPFTNTLHYNSD